MAARNTGEAARDASGASGDNAMASNGTSASSEVVAWKRWRKRVGEAGDLARMEG